MQLSRDPNQGKYVIRRYEAGTIVINEDTYHHSVIVSPDHLITNWPPQTFNELQSKHFQAIINLNPEIILLGTGKTQIFPSASLLAPFYEKNMGVEIMDTGAACRTFAVLTAEARNVVAALLIQ